MAPPISGFEGILGCYVIRSDKTALLDVGPTSSLPNLMQALDKLEVKPDEIDYVIAGHIHLDHSGGMGGSLKLMHNATGIVHEKGRYHLANPSKLWAGSLQVLGKLAEDYGQPEPIADDRLVTASEGMIIDLGGIKLEVFLTPGHAAHHLSFFDRQRKRLFAGEAVGINFPGIGSRPATPYPFDLRQAIASLDKLIALQPETIYYAHVGYSNNALDKMLAFKKQLLRFGRVISKHLDDSSNWQEILEEIKRDDKELAGLYDMPPDRLAREMGFIQNNIFGFREYLRKEGPGVISELERGL